MSGIFGVVDLSAPAPDALEFEAISARMARWGRGACRHAALEGARFGRVETISTSGSGEDLPTRWVGDTGIFTAEGRLDNRDDLCNGLNVPLAARAALSDGGLMLAAYVRWGEACAERLLGDWSFAAWHPHQRRLVLGRDHLGNTALYYARAADTLAFASCAGALLALPWVPRRLNEIRLARILGATPEEPEEDGSCTIYRDVHLLRPAQIFVATPQGERRRQYWQLEPGMQAELGSDTAYAEALLEGLRTAVRCRLPSDRLVGSMLSAGLDSTSISVLAAGELARRDQRLTAFTSVPAFEVPYRPRGTVHDEGPLAAAVAGSMPNIDHVLIDARQASPIAAMRAMLRIHGEPRSTPSNNYWILALLSEAAQRGVEVLLTGQLGNHALSWRGPRAGWLTELRRKRFGHAARLAVRPLVPAPARCLVRGYRLRQFRARWGLAESPWRLSSALRASFARDVGLLANPPDAASRANDRDLRFAQMCRSARQAGAAWKQLCAAFGIGVRDPSQDVRLISLAFSIPDRLWQGPMDRWLWRTATKGVLPDEVRLNGRSGLQAADIVERLRAHRTDVDDALAEVADSPLAQRCIDLPYCRRIVAAIDGPPDPFVSLAVRVVLMRALGVGLFLAASDRPGMVEP